jgi:hypothetical protein
MIHCELVRRIFKDIDDRRCEGPKVFVDLDCPSHVHKDNLLHHLNHVCLAQMEVSNEDPCHLLQTLVKPKTDIKNISSLFKYCVAFHAEYFIMYFKRLSSTFFSLRFILYCDYISTV